jgi:protein TonB
MPTITNESVAGGAQGANTGTPNGSAGQPRREAVGVEVPVVIHASRSSASVKGIAKPLPAVHEETRTVIVFPQGAVVRLSAEVNIGELVVLTNQKSGADVLCRVASVKAQPGIQNYVDLEFTQRAPGFWGEVFGAERPAAPAAAPSGSAAPAPVSKPSASQSPASQSPASQSPVAQSTASQSPVLEFPSASTVVPDVPSAPAPQPVAAAPKAAETPAPAAVPQALPTVPAEPSPATRDSSSNVTGSVLSMGLQAPKTQEWTQRIADDSSKTQDTANSKKTLLMAAAAVVLLVITVGAFLLMRGHAPAQVAQQVAAAAVQTPPIQPVAAVSAGSTTITSPQATASAVPAVAPPPSAVAAAPAQPKVVSNAPVEPAAAPASKSFLPGRLVTKIAAPRARASSLSSAEPPPMLPASANAAALGGNLLVGTASADAPPLPGLSGAGPVAGGRFEEPKLLSSPAPTYPQAAMMQHIQGDVTVDALIDGTGHVSVAKVISGNPLLQQAALAAVRTWKYQPARLDGDPRAAHIQVKITFRLP